MSATLRRIRTTATSRGALLLAATLLGGCPPDLSGYTVGPGPDSGRDGSSPPPPPPPGTCEPEVTCPGGCPLPWLLASVEDLGGACGGRVWRWSLTGPDDQLCACEALDGGGAIPAQPSAIGFLPPRTVVVAAGNESVMAIDGETDSVLWTEPYELLPVDVFAIEDPDGRSMVGVAGGRDGGDISSVDLYDGAAGGAPIHRTTNGDLPIGLSVEGITQSPFDRRWMRVLRSDGRYAAADVDPWNDLRFDMPLHTVARDGFYLHTIHASYDGRFHRTVWTGERSDLPDRPSGIYRLARADDTGDNRVPLAERCDERPECTWIHAVADPSLNTASIGLCGYGPDERRILRVRSVGDCTLVVDQATFSARVRISRLALGQETFWAP